MRSATPSPSRAALLLWTWAFAATVVTADDGSNATRGTAEGTSTRELVRQSYRYAPPQLDAVADFTTAEPAVEMTPVVVAETKIEDRAARQLERQHRLEAQRAAAGPVVRPVRLGKMRLYPYRDVMIDDARFRTGRPDVARFTLVSWP